MPNPRTALDRGRSLSIWWADHGPDQESETVTPRPHGIRIDGEDSAQLEAALIQVCRLRPDIIPERLAFLDGVATNPERTPEQNRGNAELRDRLRQAVAS